ncbi:MULTISPECIES: DnaA N-terminal domain-containing protein [Shimia]|uniref:DnaA N-terminal domain-containing protein n=1 Tax=Shimia TaxID=573139 RepID=UPI001FB44F98|nr:MULTISPECIES: DnaA N-terminal domain-containing protein [Shimia]MDV4146488.1 DnaA N-terminal domain-containing protein [Shimia sp. FJ5]
MQIAKPVGREAASRKYDILSALMAFALSEDRTIQRQVMRMMALITTRYNWQRDELSMGQEDIARLWSVDTRTVKREMAKLRAKGWLVLKRQGARGRVSVYGLDLELMLEDTRHVWSHIGPDFIDRLTPDQPSQNPTPDNVVPLHTPARSPVADGSLWSEVQKELHQIDPAVYGAWFHGLSEAGVGAGRLHLMAPSRFHASYVKTHLMSRVLAVVRRIDPSIHDVVIEC